MRIELPCSSNPNGWARSSGRVHDPAVCEWVMAAMGLNSVTDWAVTHYVGGRRANPKVERREGVEQQVGCCLLFTTSAPMAELSGSSSMPGCGDWRKGIGFQLARILSVTLNI